MSYCCRFIHIQHTDFDFDSASLRSHSLKTKIYLGTNENRRWHERGNSKSVVIFMMCCNDRQRNKTNIKNSIIRLSTYYPSIKLIGVDFCTAKGQIQIQIAIKSKPSNLLFDFGWLCLLRELNRFQYRNRLAGPFNTNRLNQRCWLDASTNTDHFSILSTFSIYEEKRK